MKKTTSLIDISLFLCSYIVTLDSAVLINISESACMSSPGKQTHTSVNGGHCKLQTSSGPPLTHPQFPTSLLSCAKIVFIPIDL